MILYILQILVEKNYFNSLVETDKVQIALRRAWNTNSDRQKDNE